MSDQQETLNHSEYSPKPPSTRALAVRRLVKLLEEQGVVFTSPEKAIDRCWSCKLISGSDGVLIGLECFSERYFRVTWDLGDGVPDRRVYVTEIEAETAILALAKRDLETAMAVPVRQFKIPEKKAGKSGKKSGQV